MSAALLRQAAALREQFRQTLPSQGAGRRLLEGVQAFYDAAVAFHPDETATEAEAAQLRRAITTLAEQLAAFDEMAAEPLSRPWPGPQPLISVQVMAGCEAIAACAFLGNTLGLGASDTYRVSAAASLVFNAGKAVLANTLQTVGKVVGAEGRLPQISTAQGGDPRPVALASLASQVKNQLAPASIIPRVLLHSSTGSSAAAAFAASAACRGLLGWLATVTQCMELLAAKGDPGLTTNAMLLHYCWLVEELLSTPAFAQHSQALANTAGMQQAATRYLLCRCLPRLAGAVQAVDPMAGPDFRDKEEVMLLSVLARVLAIERLEPAVSMLLRQPGGPGLVQHAVSIVQALPGSCPPSAQPKVFYRAHGEAALLLAVLCNTLFLPSPPAEAAAAAGGSHGGNDASAAINGGSAANVDANREQGFQEREAAWAVVKLITRVAEIVSVAAAKATSDRDSNGWQRDLAIVCTNHCNAFEAATQRISRYMTTPHQFAIWAAAADAGTRLQPALAQLDRGWRQQQQLMVEPDCQHAAGRLSQELLRRWQHTPPVLFLPTQHAMLVEPLWQLHTSSCRLLHWLLRDSEARLAGIEAANTDTWRWLQHGLHKQFNRACELAQIELTAASLRQLAAMCAAHWEAAVATTPAVADSWQPKRRAPGEPPSVYNNYIHDLEEALLHVSCYCPGVVWPDFLQPLEPPLAALVKAGPDFLRARLIVLCRIVGSALRQPIARLAACFMASPVLPALCLDTAAEAAGAADNDTAHQAKRSLSACYEVLIKLEEAAAEAISILAASGRPQQDMSSANVGGTSCADSSGGNSSGCNGAAQGSVRPVASQNSLEADSGRAELGCQLPDALAELQAQRMHLCTERSWTAGTASEQASALRKLLQPASRLASLLQQCFQLPDHRRLAAIELAEAAAERSCAYLRCANVAGGGGPAAGQGAGSQKCSACRVVRYCGTACSHADWRAGGHKRVCKALAAKKQQQQQ